MKFRKEGLCLKLPMISVYKLLHVMCLIYSFLCWVHHAQGCQGLWMVNMELLW